MGTLSSSRSSDFWGGIISDRWLQGLVGFGLSAVIWCAPRRGSNPLESLGPEPSHPSACVSHVSGLGFRTSRNRGFQPQLWRQGGWSSTLNRLTRTSPKGITMHLGFAGFRDSGLVGFRTMMVQTPTNGAKQNNK